MPSVKREQGSLLRHKDVSLSLLVLCQRVLKVPVQARQRMAAGLGNKAECRFNSRFPPLKLLLVLIQAADGSQAARREQGRVPRVEQGRVPVDRDAPAMDDAGPVPEQAQISPSQEIVEVTSAPEPPVPMEPDTSTNRCC